jgi:hypothetical protein
MRITFRKQGGIAYLPGLSRPVTIDTASLGPKDAEELHSLVEQAKFFELPSTSPAASPGADRQHYSITVEDGVRSHSLQVADPIADECLARLIGTLKDRVRQALK